jgi:medium-chain acyl-[acyl-carrier-protein] hydrolase
MFYEFDRHLDIADYGADGLLRVDSILKIFQEAAVEHSASIGYTTDSYMGSGNIWMHNKNLFKVNTLPDFSQPLRVKTWSRGIDKFKGFRNYQIFADGKECITGSSVWIYLNIKRRRPVRPTEEMLERYDSEDIAVLDDMIKTLNHSEPSADADEIVISLRTSDFDVNGHVSNVVYGQFFQSALQKYGADIIDSSLSISYMHEIKPETTEVVVKTEKIDSGYRMGVYADDKCACLGEVTIGG